MYMAPCILANNVCRILLLFLFAVLIAGAVYKSLQLEVYFSQMYFVSDRSKINEWFQANEEYFQPGGAKTVTYVYDNTMKGLNFSDVDI